MEKENKIMKLGFIGTGNMAGAIMGGIIRNEIFKPEEIIGADISKESRSKVQSAYGINVTEDNKPITAILVIIPLMRVNGQQVFFHSPLYDILSYIFMFKRKMFYHFPSEQFKIWRIYYGF